MSASLVDFCWKIALFVGIAFPCLSLLTGISSLVHSWRFKKHTSPIFIPLIGPLCLSGLVIHFGKPLWLIPIVWIADIGTVAFLLVAPHLIADWWNVSGFTRILMLCGSQGVQSAVLTLHSTGHYLLKKSWQRPVNAEFVVSENPGPIVGPKTVLSWFPIMACEDLFAPARTALIL